MKTDLSKLPKTADELTPAQIQSLATDAGLDPQRVERLIQVEIAETPRSSATTSLISQLFDGWMMIGGQWLQPTLAIVEQARKQAEQYVEQARREIAVADRIESHLQLVAQAERRAREDVVATNASIEPEPNVVTSGDATLESGDYSSAAYS